MQIQLSQIQLQLSKYPFSARGIKKLHRSMEVQFFLPLHQPKQKLPSTLWYI